MEPNLVHLQADEYQSPETHKRKEHTFNIFDKNALTPRKEAKHVHGGNERFYTPRG